MGRHRSAKSNSGVAKELIYGLIAVVVVIALVIGWFQLRDRNSQQQNATVHCPAGELIIPVASLGGAHPVTDLQNEFLATNPVVKDLCVKGFSDAPLAKSAVVYTGDADAGTKKSLADARKSAVTSDWPVVSVEPVGVAAPADKVAMLQAKDWAKLTDLALVTEQNLAATIARDALTNPPGETIPQAEAAEQHKSFVTADPAMPSGYSFIVPEHPTKLQLPTRLLAVGTSTDVTEEQSRAAAEFVAFAAKKSPQLSEADAAAFQSALAAAPLPAKTAATTQTPAPTDTLFVLDTSDNLGPLFQQVTSAVASRAAAIGAKGVHVGLWNYSSPLTPGVTQGWRPNVALSDASNGQNAATAVKNLGYGGLPYTHEAVVNALRNAQEVASESKKPVKVVLVTTGTADAGSQGALASALANVDSKQVALHVVHVGPHPVDEDLAAWAREHGGTATAAKNDTERDGALDKALGL